MGRALGIALVLWSGQIGGAESFTADLARAMRDLETDARVLFVTRGSMLAERLDQYGVPWQELGHATGSHVALHPLRLAKAVAQLGPDAALVPSVGYLAASLRLGGYRAPIVAVEHNGALFRGGEAARIRSRDETIGLWAVSAQVAVSDALRGAITRRPRTASRVVTINNGVDAERFSPSHSGRNGRLRVGAAGRLVRGKGFDTLVESCAPLLASDDIDLQIGGIGPERSRLERAFADAGVSPDGRLLGSVADMPSFWRSCDVAVVPSLESESFGMVAIEAMSCGIPVVASRQPALAEVVEEDETGALVEAGDVSALRGALQRYIDDEALRRNHGEAARRRVLERFTVQSSASSYIDFIRSLKGPVSS